MTSVYKDSRDEINAGTIYAEVLRAAAMAPTKEQLADSAWTKKEAYRLAFARGLAYGFEVENLEDTEEASDSRGPGSARHQQSADYPTQWTYQLEAIRHQAYSECMQSDTSCARSHITFKTGARSSHRVVNTRERLTSFAAKIKANAKHFGGGMIKPEGKAKPDVHYSPKTLSLFKQLIEDSDYSAALDLATDKLGALFCLQANGRAALQVAPVPVDGMPGLCSVLNEDGTYSVIEPVSMRGVEGARGKRSRTRATQVEIAQDVYNHATQESRDRVISEAESLRVDQAEARAQWMAEHGIEDESTLQARINDHISEQARQDVAQVLEAATMAAAAIEQAQAEPVEVEARELVAAECESGAALAVCELNGAGSEGPGQVGRAASNCSNRASAPAPSAPHAPAPRDIGAGPTWSDLVGDVAPGAPDPENINFDALSASEVRSWSAGQFQAVYDYFEDINYHGECVLLHALRSGHGPFIDQARRIISDHRALGYLSPALRDERYALSDNIKHMITAIDAPAPAETRRAPRPFVPISLETAARGVVWRITVRRYWLIDSVAESADPDMLCWRAEKRGGKYAAVSFSDVSCDRVPRDIAQRAHEFTLAVQAQDRQQATAAAAIAPASAPSAEVSSPAPDSAGQNAGGPSSGQLENPAATPCSETGAPGGALSITLTRAEGLSSECGQPQTVHSFAAADALLRVWSESAPKSGGYDKCDFAITWANGDTYGGRYDLKHHRAERPSLTDHMIDAAEFALGKYCPAHMTSAKYAQHVERITESERAAYAGILQTMADLGAYFPRVRPVAVDLRAMVAAGAKVEDLIGLGVIFTGSRYSDAGRGAIVSASECKHYGLIVDVLLESGAERRAVKARDFADVDGAEYRLDGKMHGAPYLAQLAAALASVKASESAAKAQAQAAHAAELVALADEYSYLQRVQPGAKSYGCTLAAANMRTLLRRAFPGVKFSVKTSKFSGGDSIDVHWTDGPTSAQVDAITDQFSAGSFDGMDDSYTYSHGAFAELFGDAKYVSSCRALSDAAVSEIMAQLWPDESTRPSLDDWHHGRQTLCDEHNRNRVHMASINWQPGAPVTP